MTGADETTTGADGDAAGSATDAGVAAAAGAPRGRRRRLGWLAAGLIVVVAGAVVAWLVGTRVRSPEQAAADAAPPERAVVTVPVELRVLESSVVTRGDVAPEVAVEVTGPSPAEGGQAVVTGVFVEVGDEVSAGVPVAEVSGRPVFVMDGARPVFRALGPGLSGADVAQLQAGLGAGGCDAGDSAVFDEATKVCVAELYEAAGYSVVRTSETEEADLAEFRETVAAADDELVDAQAALEDAEAGPTELELLDARQAVDTALSGLNTATTSGADGLRDATGAVDDALRGLNAELVAANPDADDDTGGSADDGSGGDSGGGAGDGGGGAGVAARADAADALDEALDAVASARVTGEVEVGEAEAALTRAETELATLEAPPDLADEQRAVDQAAQRLERAQSDLAALEASSGPTVPLGELVFVPSLPARVDSSSATVGQAVGDAADSPGGAGDPAGAAGAAGEGSAGLMVLSSAGLVVNAEIPAGDAALVSVGAEAELLEETSGTVLKATVVQVGASLVQSESGGLVSPLVLDGVDDLPAEWSGRNVRVTFTAATTQTPVLVVPAIAVSSGADGNERVETVAADGSISTVAVRTGLEAEGFVEVTPLTAGELDEGDKVVTDR